MASEAAVTAAAARMLLRLAGHERTKAPPRSFMSLSGTSERAAMETRVPLQLLGLGESLAKTQ